MRKKLRFLVFVQKVDALQEVEDEERGEEGGGKEVLEIDFKSTVGGR